MTRRIEQSDSLLCVSVYGSTVDVSARDWRWRRGGVLVAGNDAADARFFPLGALPPDHEIAFDTDRLVLARVQAERPPFVP